MTIRSIQNTESMDAIWEELIYTEARLLQSPPGRDQAPLFKQQLASWEKVAAGQRQMWRAETIAQAQVDAENDDLDAQVDEIEAGLQRLVHRDRSDPRYTRYFKRPRSEVLHQALDSELETVRDWPKSLSNESDTELKALGKKLEKQIQSGDDALAERKSAAAARADHRVRDINDFIEAVNAARQSAYGALITRGQKEGLPKSWAESFFRKSRSSRPAASDPNSPPASAD